MKPIMGIKQQNEGELAKTRYWANIGGSGISPDILERTGFWSESVVNKMREKGVDTSQSIEQIFGGIIKFKPLPGRESEILRYNIMSAINLDLQIRKMINHVDEEIVNLLKEKWNEDDMSLLPDDLPEEKKKMIISKFFSDGEPPYLMSISFSFFSDSVLVSLKSERSVRRRIYTMDMQG